MAHAQNMPDLGPRQAVAGFAQRGTDRFDFLLSEELVFHDERISPTFPHFNFRAMIKRRTSPLSGRALLAAVATP